jgi:tRNA-specific 2-thiouridylase
LGLRTAEKPESFEICFVPDNNYAGVLRCFLGDDHPALLPGPVLLENGRQIAEHSGYARYTVGQRKRLPGGFSEPMYVLEIQPNERAVVIGSRASLSTSRLSAGSANWLSSPPEAGEPLGVRIRHGAPIVDAIVLSVREEGFDLELTAPLGAVTPGQSAVLYKGEVVVGGGVIR